MCGFGLKYLAPGGASPHLPSFHEDEKELSPRGSLELLTLTLFFLLGLVCLAVPVQSPLRAENGLSPEGL